MMFLTNILSKMKQDMPMGGRFAGVRNAGPYSPADAGQGEHFIAISSGENHTCASVKAARPYAGVGMTSARHCRRCKGI